MAAFSPGARVGSYEIVSRIGAGGMGEVYRARDPRLGRDVAVKVLPPDFANDPERRARFEREARTLASLNHPHIAQVHGFEASIQDGSAPNLLVMELVEGEDLAERLARGPIPLDDALVAAHQIAQALEAAHEQGVIHRDLKPANIKVRADGTVKVLDFGLAKAMDPVPGASPSASMSPTITSPAVTRAGIILGTAAYMAPEQAKGKPVDKRADVWAFGCVFYEMLARKRAFSSDGVAETLAAVITKEPDWNALPSDLPPVVRRLLQRCLTKDPKQRLHDIADARLELDDARDPSGRDVRLLPPRPRWQWAVPIAVITLAALAAGWFLRAVTTSPTDGAAAAEVRLEIATPPTTDPLSLAISPDGQTVVFVATSNGRPALWLRRLDSTIARPLSGTADASFPFWSPDGRAIAFFADRELKRLDLDAGSVQTLAPAEGGRGGTWSRDGTIVFQASPGPMPLVKISAAGGTPVPLGDLRGRFPQFLPDGRHFTYYASYGAAESATRGVYVALADGSDARHLFDADSGPVYSASGHLLFVRGGTLTAHRFDPATLELKGEPFPVAGDVAVNGPMLHAPIASSAGGPVLYRTGSSSGIRQFVWVDRAGTEIQKLGEPVSNPLSPAMSPDGRSIALHQTINGNTDIWLLQTARGVLQRVTSSPSAQFHPVWFPDGSRLAFGSGANLVSLAIGESQEQTLVAMPAVASPSDWSFDGRFLLFTTTQPNPSSDLWVLPFAGDGKPFAIAQTAFDERDPQFSPRADWIAYTSDQSGRPEVYVVPFPDPGERVQISTSGGGMARWRADGSELFYVALDGRMMAVPIRRTGARQLNAGTPAPLFMTRIGGPVQSNSRSQFVVSPDGKRFLLNTLADVNAAPIIVMMNWQGERTERAGP